VLMPMRTLIDLPPRLPRSGDVDFFQRWCEGTADGDVEAIIDRWWRQDRQCTNKGTPPDDAHPAASPGPDDPTPRASTGARQRLAELAAQLGGKS